MRDLESFENLKAISSRMFKTTSRIHVDLPLSPGNFYRSCLW